MNNEMAQNPTRSIGGYLDLMPQAGYSTGTYSGTYRNMYEHQFLCRI